ncbi:TIR domain-containing protein [Desulfocastanea catecholica]
MKIFISYSHADSSHFDLFKKHLVTLKRTGVLKDWSDKELIAGDHLDETIKKNLENSDVVVFLISVDFLNSFYCYQKEFTETIDRLEFSKQRIAPIIVRNCDWKDGIINEYKCITVNDKAISSHIDPDTAWLDVVGQIKEMIHVLEKKKEATKKSETHGCLALRKEFVNELESTSISFHHPIKEKLKLSDIYIYPQVKKIADDIDRLNYAINSEDVFQVDQLSDKILLIGDEQIGKTSLAYMLTKKFHSEKCLPLLLRGDKITRTDPLKFLTKIIKNQYEIDNASLYFECNCETKCKRIAIIDSFHSTSLNEKSQGLLLKNLTSIFDVIVIFSDNISRYFDSNYIKLSEFDQFEILPFGHKLKDKLVEKWNSLGQEDTLNIRELHTQNNIIIQHLNSIIRKNILDSKPIFLLIVLQSIESAKPNDYSLTSYGHCYQYLITQNFEKASVKAGELDTFFNYLTELSYFIYSQNCYSLTDTELQQFQNKYSEKYFIKSHIATVNKLVETGILHQEEGRTRFGYKYVYYFYVAKYLADHINDPSVVTMIEQLCAKLHVEKNANILIFLTHHSKDSSIVDEIYLHVSDIFHDVKVAKLDRDDTTCLQEFINLIPEKVFKQRDVSKEREAYFDRKDRMDEGKGNCKNNDKEDERDDFENKDDMILNLIQSLKSIDLIGQILRNRYGSLTKNQLIDLGKVAIDAGFKLLKFHLSFAESVQKEILQFIEDRIRENGQVKDEDVIKWAKKIYLALNYGIAYGIINKIAKSIGSDAIISLLEELKTKYKNSPAFRVMAIAIKLNFTSMIPKKEIEKVLKELESIPITRRLLRDIIVQHAHLHHIEYKDRQWITNTINISMDNQRMIDLKVH